jgi:hypothetical protein
VILRILEEGQYEFAEDLVDELNVLDDELVSAIEAGDHARFERALNELLARVRAAARQVSDDYLGPSDLVLPGAEFTLDDVRAMLGQEGLIPG